MFKKFLQRLQMRIAAWRLRSQQNRFDRLRVVAPISKLDAYIDPATLSNSAGMSREHWIRLIAELSARRDAAIAEYGPDPLNLRVKND